MKVFQAWFSGPDLGGHGIVIEETKAKALIKLKEKILSTDDEIFQKCAEKCTEDDLIEIDLNIPQCIIQDKGYYS